MSEDGLCAIDIAPAKNGGDKIDHTTWAKIRRDAKSLLDECVIRRSRYMTVGGIVRNVGVKGNLVITIESYNPNVSCYENPLYHDDGWCLYILNTLPVHWRSFQYQRSGRKSGNVDVIGDGKRYTDPEGKCTGLLKLEPDSTWERSDPYAIWTAAVAVDRMCVQRDQIGEENGRLTMALGP